MIVPKLSRYMVQEMLEDGTPHPYCRILDVHSPEEAVEEYISLGFMGKHQCRQEKFLVTNIYTETEHYVLATYGWSCKKICKPKELK